MCLLSVKITISISPFPKSSTTPLNVKQFFQIFSLNNSYIPYWFEIISREQWSRDSVNYKSCQMKFLVKKHFNMMMIIYYFLLVCINISSKKDLTKAKTETREVNKALKFILSVIFVKLEELKLPLSQAAWKEIRQWARCGKREGKQNCFLPGWENQILNYR